MHLVLQRQYEKDSNKDAIADIVDGTGGDPNSILQAADSTACNNHGDPNSA